MFLHQLKKNISSSLAWIQVIVLLGFIRADLELFLGYSPRHCLAEIPVAAAAIGVLTVWSLAKTAYQWTIVRFRHLRTFMRLLRQFCRTYWSKATVV